MKRTIESIYDHVDHIIAVDGKFNLRMGEDYSTDGSTEYLQSLDKVTVKKYVGYEDGKRNVYMDEAEKMGDIDALLIIDTDEYIEGNWEPFKKAIEDNLHQPNNFLSFTLYVTKDNPTPVPRIFIRPHEIKYYKAHNYVKIHNKIQIIKPIQSIEGVVMRQDDDLRDTEWVEKTFYYQKRLILHEKQFREEFYNAVHNTPKPKDVFILEES